MKIDLHTHAKWSKNIEFSYDYYLGMMREAGKYLDAVALTEHFNTLNFQDMFAQLDKHCHYEGNYYVVEGVKVFPGIEVDVLENGHILLIGARESILAVHSRLENHTVEGEFIKLEHLLDLSKEYDCVSIGAHPFREANPLYQVKPQLLARLDALDLNGRDLHHYGKGMKEKVQSLAELIDLPVVAGSDTHQPLQFGSVFNRFEQACDTIEQLRAVLRRGAYDYQISEHFHQKVQLAEAEQARYKKELRVAP
jgi:histidinol phosphatase-like PHP family hydrolase